MCRSTWAVRAELVAFGVAGAARLSVIAHGGGLRSAFGYDAPVYFAASDAFVHGRLPYRDFVLLHPPGIMLALTPFAALTKVLTDQAAFAVADLSFAVVGAVCAVLVVRVGRRLGFGTGALIGGLAYAAWWGSIEAEYLVRLEPLGNLL